MSHLKLKNVAHLLDSKLIELGILSTNAQSAIQSTFYAKGADYAYFEIKTMQQLNKCSA